MKIPKVNRRIRVWDTEIDDLSDVNGSNEGEILEIDSNECPLFYLSKKIVLNGRSNCVDENGVRIWRFSINDISL